ncbi:zinc finger protein 182-like [Plodia interpunctella]|uniref:zinc finger protein 182-like n=1 Tax=Plodia interpunctella TaxID=58824 RepID=UPI0023675427|nr:zinc finger protein 182-like [Plodia interpunctella]
MMALECRTCLNTQNLSPIFTIQERAEKYTEAIFNASSVTVKMNDNLPQVMCSTCIDSINENIKFRRKAQDTEKILLNRLNNTSCDVKIEPSDSIKLESNENNKSILIVVSDLEDFKDYDDNVTLDTLQYNLNEKLSSETEMQYGNSVEQQIEVNKELKRTRLKRKDNPSKINRKEKTDIKEKEEIECEICNKILTSRLSLRNHYKIHTGFDVVCEHCGKKFITRRLLLMHCRAKHGYEKTDKCSYCDYKASNAEQVKIHERTHTGEKPYVCAECGAGFHRKSSYLQHVAIHLPEKNVQCDQCPARFKSITLMRIHKNRHRGPQYTYRCTVCNNSFARRRNVARHLQRIHGLQPQQHIDRLKIS